MNPSLRVPSAFVFVGTPAEFGRALPFRLSARMVLRRASSSEVPRIKKYIANLSGHFPTHLLFESNFEVERTVTKDAPLEIVYHRPLPLPTNQWRYHVVAISRYAGNPFTQDFPDLIQLRVSSQLSLCPLFLNSATLRNFSHSLNYADDWHRYSNASDDDHIAFQYEKTHLADWRSTFAQIEKVRTNFPLIWHTLKLFSEVPVAKGRNELTVLALFAVLESLLTHNPRGEFDSITHQIGAKIALLSKRLDITLDYSPFGNTSPEAVWKKLYELRSRIAHGSEITFSGALQVLDDAYSVELFMFATLKAVLRFAVQEPQLVLDLKSV